MLWCCGVLTHDSYTRALVRRPVSGLVWCCVGTFLLCVYFSLPVQQSLPPRCIRTVCTVYSSLCLSGVSGLPVQCTAVSASQVYPDCMYSVQQSLPLRCIRTACTVYSSLCLSGVSGLHVQCTAVSASQVYPDCLYSSLCLPGVSGLPIQ